MGGVLVVAVPSVEEACGGVEAKGGGHFGSKMSSSFG